MSTSFWSMEMSINQLGSLVCRLSQGSALRSPGPEWRIMERARARGDGKVKHYFFFFPFRFLLCLAVLDNQIKYPENHRERLRTRQVSCILIMKSIGAGIWTNDGRISHLCKITFKAIEKYRYGFRKTVSKHLKWRKCKMTSDEYLMAWNKYCGKLYLIITHTHKKNVRMEIYEFNVAYL